MQPDHVRFPSGIKALADFVHSLGLKFGIYEDYGTATCEGYPGVIDHLELDAQSNPLRLILIDSYIVIILPSIC